MAAAGGIAPVNGAQPPSVSRARAVRRRAAAAACSGRLAAALARVLELEAECASLRAAAAAAGQGELLERLALVTPVLQAGINGAAAGRPGEHGSRVHGGDLRSAVPLGFALAGFSLATHPHLA